MIDAKSVKPGTPDASHPTVRSPAVQSPPLLTRTQKFKLVLDEVSTRHDVPIELLLSKARPWFVVAAKRELAYLLRIRTGWSLVIIARMTKTKDHTIVRHRIVQHCAANKLKLPDGVSRGILKVRRKRRRT